MRCVRCGGARKVSCSSCGGRRHKSRFTMSGEVEVIPCLVCGGTGRVKCHVCHGRGEIQDTVIAVAPPKPDKKAPRATALSTLHKEVRQVVAAALSVSGESIDIDIPLAQQPIGFDDLAWIEIVMEIEGRYAVSIGESDLESDLGSESISIRHLADFISRSK